MNWPLLFVHGRPVNTFAIKCMKSRCYTQYSTSAQFSTVSQPFLPEAWNGHYGNPIQPFLIVVFSPRYRRGGGA